MPRIRTIKPGFFRSEDVSPLPLRARLTWIGLWTQCDDHGRTKDSARLIKGDLWPLDEITLQDIEEDLSALARHGRIVRYTADGKQYLAIVNWHVHQAISKPSKTILPAPPVPVGPTDPDDRNYCSECSASTPGSLPEGSRNTPGGLPLGKEGKGKEGNARAPEPEPSPTGPGSPEPPRKCPQHVKSRSTAPCGACGDARRVHDAWAREQKPKPHPQPTTSACPLHPEHPTGSKACPACEAERAPAPDLRSLMARTATT